MYGICWDTLYSEHWRTTDERNLNAAYCDDVTRECC